MEKEDLVTICDAEKYVISKALKKAKGNRKKAASILQIVERTLYRKIYDYNIAINRYNYSICKN